MFLLPPNLRDWLPPGHRVWFVLRIVEQLDLSEFHAASKRGGVGRAGYHPQVLLAVLIYAYMNGQLSSRGIERACSTDVGYMVACGRDVPDHTVVARFRQQHRAALKNLFTQVLVLCVQAGMGQFGVIAIDGTKIAANASTHRNWKLSALQKRAAQLAEKLLSSAADVDAAEDARHGGGTGMDLHPLWADQDTGSALIADTLTDLADTDTDTDTDGGSGADTGCGSGAGSDGATAAVDPPPSGETTAADRPGVPATRVPGTDLVARRGGAVDLPPARVPATRVPGTDLVARPGGAVDLPPARVPATQVPGTDLVARPGGAVDIPPAGAGMRGAAPLSRRERAGRDRDARLLAAVASVQGQLDTRDAAAREPQVRHAQARLTAAQLRVEHLYTQLLATRDRAEQRVAAGGVRGRYVPVQDNVQLTKARAGLVKAQQNMARASAAVAKPSRQTHPMGNLTDPDSRKMRSSTTGGYLQGYNAQLAVSDDHLILVAAISQSTNDMSSGVPMINATTDIITTLAAATQRPALTIGTLLLDAGYCSIDIITTPGPNRLIATGKARDLKTDADNAAPTTTSGGDLSEVGKMAKRLVEPDNAAIYKRRGATVEPVNAHLKHRRGLQQFSCRGLAAVDSELNFAAMVNNLTRLHTHQHPQAPA